MNKLEQMQEKAREEWGMNIGPKSNQFDQEKVLNALITEVWNEAKVGDIVRDDSTGRWVVAKKWLHDKHIDFILLDQYTGDTMSARANITSDK